MFGGILHGGYCPGCSCLGVVVLEASVNLICLNLWIVQK